jgi:RHS repeat-associated protein
MAATTSATGDVQLNLTNLHGDVALSIDTALTSPTFLHFDEFGAPASGQTASRYGWLGGKQRAAEGFDGIILMGVRLYSPTLGRFLQVDPIDGGSATDYDYCAADPVNCLDLDGRWFWIAARYLLRVQPKQTNYLQKASVGRSPSYTTTGRTTYVTTSGRTFRTPGYGRASQPNNRSANSYIGPTWGYQILYEDQATGKTKVWKWGITSVTPWQLRALVGVARCLLHRATKRCWINYAATRVFPYRIQARKWEFQNCINHLRTYGRTPLGMTSCR